jgi:N-acetylmuramate 1-kinase
VVLRDFHVDNLMFLENRSGIKKVGLLDFQDAVVGSAAYDIVSLLEDARRDVSPQLADHLISRYLKSFPKIHRKDFQAAYSIFGIQRNLKIIGFCAAQAAKHKNPYYLSLLPRVWRYINQDLKHPLLLPMKNWLIKVLPAQMKIYK